ARIDDFAPSTMLDAGAGPGTASWSALEALPSLASVVQLDHNANLLALGQTLASTVPVLGSAERVRGDLTRALPPGRRFDLVVAAYALTELSDAQLPAAASA